MDPPPSTPVIVLGLRPVLNESPQRLGGLGYRTRLVHRWEKLEEGPFSVRRDGHVYESSEVPEVCLGVFCVTRPRPTPRRQK